jgi:tetratricopeptide (TPR) repeat protein
VRKRRKSVRAQHEQIRRAELVRECLSRSDEALLSGNIDESLSHLKNARTLVPDCEDIKARIQSMEHEKGCLDNYARVVEEVERAKAFGDFAGALRIAAKALQEDPTNQELLALNAALAGNMEMELQQGTLLELVERAERDLTAGNYDAAVDLLNEAAKINPSHERTEKLRWELAKARGLEERRAFLEDIQLQIRDLFKKEAYDEASGLVDRALATFPDEMLLHRLRAEIEAEERRYDVRQVVDLVIAEVDQLFTHSSMEAMAVLEKALDNMPDEARLVAYELALRQQLESHRPQHPAGARF